MYGLKLPVGTPSGRVPQVVVPQCEQVRRCNRNWSTIGSITGEVGDLVDQRRGVIAEQGMGAAPAGAGPAVGGGAQLLGGHQGALRLGVSRLSAGLPPGGWCGWLALQADGIRRRGLGGIGGIEVEPGLEVGDPLILLVRSGSGESRRRP